MKPFYQRGPITIYHGDCREVLPRIIGRGECVDLIASDVSYDGISGGSGQPGDGSPCGILSSNDGKIFEYNNVSTADYAELFYWALRNPAHCYLFINNLNLRDALNDFDQAGFKLHNTLAWVKGNKVTNRWYMKAKEDILFFRKGAAFSINNHSASNVLFYPQVPKAEKRHETEKPVLLMQELVVNSSQPAELVLDPFMGSGSTLEACFRTRRRAIGIDLDPYYCEVAARRLDALFDVPAAVQLSLMGSLTK